MADVSYDDGLYTPDTTYDGYVTATTTEAWWEAETTDWATWEEEATMTTTTATMTAITTTTAAVTTTRAAVTTTTTTPPGISFASLASWSSLTTTTSAPVFSPMSPTIRVVATSSTTPASSSSYNPRTTLSRPSLASATSSSSSTSSAKSFNILYLIPIFVVVPLAIVLGCMGWSYGRWWGRRRDEGVITEEEESGLVEGKFINDDNGWNEKQEQRNSGISSRSRGGTGSNGGGNAEGWATYFPEPLRKVLTSSDTDYNQQLGSIPYSSIDQGFIPPSASRANGFLHRSESTAGRNATERGWTWGSNRGDPPGRSDSWRWGSMKYRAKGGSRSSKRSTYTFEPASPSIYSPTMENGAYGVLSDENDEEREAALDRLLAESRVGDSELARKYLTNRITAADFPSSSLGRQPTRASATVPPPIPLPSLPDSELPQAPKSTYTSPVKSTNKLVRGKSRQNLREGETGLLFSHESPSRDSETPARTITAGPFSTTSPVRTSSAHPGQIFSQHPIGAPMPQYNPNAINASASAYSLNGVQDLVFGGPSSAAPPPPSASTSRDVFTELPAKKFEQPTQLKPSAPIQRRPISTAPPDGFVWTIRNPDLPTQQHHQKRESMSMEPAFQPNFSAPIAIPRLDHPSPVKRAIENLESRTQEVSTTPPSARQGQEKRYSRPLGGGRAAEEVQSSPTKGDYDGRRRSLSGPRPLPISNSSSSLSSGGSSARLALATGSTKLSRSTTTLQYRDEVDDDNDNDEKNQAVGALLLHRSKTSAGLGPAATPVVQPSAFQRPPRRGPLPQAPTDSGRTTGELRSTSESPMYGRAPQQEVYGGVMSDESETIGSRRNGAAPSSGGVLRSAMKH